jgi:PPOX class probable F420-dependent enzyme
MIDALTQIPESHRPLLDGPWATLGTVDRDGRPQLTQVAFLWEDGRVRISLNETRWKVRNLRRNPALSVLVPDTANPLRYVEIRGDAEISEDPDLALAHRVGGKYGQDFTAYDRPGERRLVIDVRPARVHAVDLSA